MQLINMRNSQLWGKKLGQDRPHLAKRNKEEASSRNDSLTVMTEGNQRSCNTEKPDASQPQHRKSKVERTVRDKNPGKPF